MKIGYAETCVKMQLTIFNKNDAIQTPNKQFIKKIYDCMRLQQTLTVCILLSNLLTI